MLFDQCDELSTWQSTRHIIMSLCLRMAIVKSNIYVYDKLKWLSSSSSCAFHVVAAVSSLSDTCKHLTFGFSLLFLIFLLSPLRNNMKMSYNYSGVFHFQKYLTPGPKLSAYRASFFSLYVVPSSSLSRFDFSFKKFLALLHLLLPTSSPPCHLSSTFHH